MVRPVARDPPANIPMKTFLILLLLPLSVAAAEAGKLTVTTPARPDALGRVVRPLVEHGPRAFELSRFEQVGGYALQLFWADGHSSGIYSFSYLRKLAAIGEA